MATVLPGTEETSGPGSTVPLRRAGRWFLAIAVLLTAGLIATAAVAFAVGDGGRAVVFRDPDGDVIARVALEGGDTFAVSYRNSIYRTLAEERYRVLPDGRFLLVQIAADQLAVLEEYYGVPDPPHPAPPGDRRNYVVNPDPARPAVFDVLSIAADDLGERTLWVPGHAPVLLWQRVVSENPTVLLHIEET